MFGVIQSGKPVQTNLQQVDASRFVLAVPDHQNIGHIVVFLTTPLQSGYGATVHLGWPKESQFEWQYLGFITNDKPSAIFKISERRPAPAATASFSSINGTSGMLTDADMGRGTATGGGLPAQVGISVEPLDVIMRQAELHQQQRQQQQAMASPPGKGALVAAPPPSVSMVIARKLLTHFYNFVLSFANDGKDQAVKIMQAWHASVERKLAMDPEFLTRPDE